MWQAAVTAAAVAGSGFIAKTLFSPKTTTQTHPNPDQSQHSENTPHSPEPSAFQTMSDQCSIDEEKEGVFWFLSSGSSGKQTRKSQSRRYSGKYLDRVKENGSGFGSVNGDQRKSCGKKVTVCLKKRKTCRNSNGKGDSSCSKDCSSFGCGLGLGIMYMMSTGKAEMSKLSSAVDETAKVVHDLKLEFEKRQLLHCQKQLNFDDIESSERSMHKFTTNQPNTGACKLNKGSIDKNIINYAADSECASIVLTEEQQQPEDTEMDQLQAELESELQKLPWMITETSECKENMTDLAQMERHESLNRRASFYQSGVSPAELTDKLSHLLSKQQESQIVELESELNLAYNKLQEKEAELEALKDCVKRLTEFSLTAVSDEESEAYDKTHEPDIAIVGMKRALHS